MLTLITTGTAVSSLHANPSSHQTSARTQGRASPKRRATPLNVVLSSHGMSAAT